MMEKHYCAHPLIPGYAHPSPEGIKKWAIQQMYNFCVKHDLCEVWAYLWENWYRKGQWELHASLDTHLKDHYDSGKPVSTRHAISCKAYLFLQLAAYQTRLPSSLSYASM
jgi:hypothetical protein